MRELPASAFGVGESAARAGEGEKTFFQKEYGKEKSRAEARLFVFFSLQRRLCLGGGSGNFLIVALVEKVHRLEELMEEDERSDTDQSAEDVPTPEGARAESVRNAALVDLCTHTLTDAMEPDQVGDAEGDGGEDEGEEQEIHGLLAIFRGYDIDLFADVIHGDEGIDTERDDAENDVLQ